MQTREVNGVLEVWDGEKQCWKPRTFLNSLEKWPVQPPLDATKFLCPDCGELVRMIASVSGSETWTIDPETGERMDLIDSETHDVHEETFSCSVCFWEAGIDWWEKRNNGQQEEEEPQVVALDIETKDPIQPGLFKAEARFWPPRSSKQDWDEFWGNNVKIADGKPDKT